MDNTTCNTIQCTATINLNFTTLKVSRRTVDRCRNIEVPGLGPGTHRTRQHVHYSAKPDSDLVAHKTKRQGRRYVWRSPKLTFWHGTCFSAYYIHAATPRSKRAFSSGSLSRIFLMSSVFGRVGCFLKALDSNFTSSTSHSNLLTAAWVGRSETWSSQSLTLVSTEAMVLGGGQALNGRGPSLVIHKVDCLLQAAVLYCQHAQY